MIEEILQVIDSLYGEIVLASWITTSSEGGSYLHQAQFRFVLVIEIYMEVYGIFTTNQEAH